MLDFLSLHPGVAARFTPGKAKGGTPDLMAPFSSRGGPLQLLGTGKPDITAPGMQILAGNTPDSVTLTDAEDQLFQAIQGTSMSSPHVAGAAALVRALHRSFTPGQIKSVLLTLAVYGVGKEPQRGSVGYLPVPSTRPQIPATRLPACCSRTSSPCVSACAGPGAARPPPARRCHPAHPPSARQPGGRNARGRAPCRGAAQRRAGAPRAAGDRVAR